MIEHISKAKLSLVSSLSSAKMRRKHNAFKVEGLKSVEDILPRFRLRFIVSSENHASNFSEYISKEKIYLASEYEMGKMSSLSNAPQVIAVFDIPIVEEIPIPYQDELSLILDGVQDPGNLGTIVRAAHWFGIKRIYCSQDTVDIYNNKAVMSTMGSVGHVEVYYCVLEEILSKVKNKMPIYGALLNGEKIYDATLSRNGLIVLGSEGHGISSALAEFITNPLTIPPANPVDHPESLNVGVAAAVILSQFNSRLVKNS